ncbi:MAG TPA: phosphatidylserine/phosphatidylglycerophosphate/cardiolipin synthase family protein, partial [Myxococcota bacterium]|nr:phosphatidylserine/phosphatidylglycerophosphate/cardiolipin synthase family protein [Myxococcota bacterium]
APAPRTDRPFRRDTRPRLPVEPPRPPMGIRELLGVTQDPHPTGFAAVLRPSRVRPTVAPTYLANPASLREAFDAIPGGGPARSRQLTGNVESWASTWDMLTRATRTIDSTYFIVERDIYGFAYLGHLLRKQRQGARVRLMTDATADYNGVHGFTQQLAIAWPPQTGGKDYLEELAAAGSEVAIYHRHMQRLLRTPEALFLGTSTIAAVNHDKILVTDGYAGKTGGRNIARDYFADPADLPAAWRDGDSEVRGEEQARDFTAAFDREFRSSAASRVTRDVLGNWTARDIELIGAYHLMNFWMNDPPLDDAEQQALRGDSQRRSAMASDLLQRAIAALPADGITRAPSQRDREVLTRLANELVGYTRTRGSARTYDREERFFDAEVKIVDQTSIAAGRYNEIAPALTTLFRGAQDRIVIQNPYVVLTREEIDELARASSRGVEIWFGTNSPMSTDSTVTQAYFLEDWAYILARVPTARFFVATGTNKFHGKMAIIDDQLSIISSYNADWLSAYVNSEIAELTWSRERAADLMGRFMRDFEDPTNGVREYTIRRNPDGSAVLVDRNAGTGQPPDWQPVVVFGPENHLSRKILDEYAQRRRDWDRRRGYLAQLAPLQHPPLTYPAPAPGRRRAQ